MKRVLNLYKKYEEIINYLIVGVLTTIVSIGTYLICTLFLNPNNSIELQIANIISWVCAVSFAYFTNRIWVFKSKNKNILKEASTFVGSRIISLLMDMFVMFMIVSVLHFNDLLGKLISQIVVTIANFILSKLFVFKK